MLYLHYITDGRHVHGLYTVEEAYSLPAGAEIVFEAFFTACNKSDARQLAADIMDDDASAVNAGARCLFWSEWAYIGRALDRLARRFGLVGEFRENGII